MAADFGTEFVVKRGSFMRKLIVMLVWMTLATACFAQRGAGGHGGGLGGGHAAIGGGFRAGGFNGGFRGGYGGGFVISAASGVIAALDLATASTIHGGTGPVTTRAIMRRITPIRMHMGHMDITDIQLTATRLTDIMERRSCRASACL